MVLSVKPESRHSHEEVADLLGEVLRVVEIHVEGVGPPEAQLVEELVGGPLPEEGLLGALLHDRVVVVDAVELPKELPAAFQAGAFYLEVLHGLEVEESDEVRGGDGVVAVALEGGLRVICGIFWQSLLRSEVVHLDKRGDRVVEG